jgi:hypothetical protein
LAPEGARRSLVTRGAYRSHGDTEAVRGLDVLSGGVLVLSDAESARVEVGALTYVIRPTAPAPGAPRSIRSRALPLALAGALVLHAPLLLALLLAPPSAAALTPDREPVPARLIALLREPVIEEPEAADADPRPDTVPHRPPMWGDSQTADPIETAFFWQTGGNPPHSHFRDRTWLPPGYGDLPPCGLRAFSYFCAGPPSEGIGCALPSGAAARPGTVRPGRVEVRGSIPRDSVRRAVRRHLAEVRFCYDQGLHRDPTLHGHVTAQWIIGADGRVVASAIVSSDLRSAPVEACVASAVRRWTFPSGSGMTGVVYPFTLETE